MPDAMFDAPETDSLSAYIPVEIACLGNLAGGAVLVGGVYRTIYLRQSKV